jgi:DNA polymerase/3'-5' exonuclease PolX
MELEEAKVIAGKLKARLEPVCERIEIAGSIRRQRPLVRDIELLCIPRFIDGVDMLDREIASLVARRVLRYRPNKFGGRVYGLKNKFMLYIPASIGVDIFSTDFECWAVALVVRTGGRATNRRIATTALRRGIAFTPTDRALPRPMAKSRAARSVKYLRRSDFPILSRGRGSRQWLQESVCITGS